LDWREEEDLRGGLSKFFATQIHEVVWQWLANGVWKLDTRTSWNVPHLNGSGLGPFVVNPTNIYPLHSP